MIKLFTCRAAAPAEPKALSLSDQHDCEHDCDGNVSETAMSQRQQWAEVARLAIAQYASDCSVNNLSAAARSSKHA